MEGELYACHYDFVTFLEPCTPMADTMGGLGPSPPSTPDTRLPLSPETPPAGDGDSVVTTVAGFSGCTCEARSVSRLMEEVDWNVGLSDAFVWLVFDLLLLSLLRVGGIYYVMNYSDLSLASLRDRADVI